VNKNKIFQTLRISATGLLLAGIFATGFITPALAATAPGNGLRVSPVRTDETITAGQTVTLTITVTNVTSTSASFQAIINDFVANPNESGEPALILNPNQYADSHSLKRFVKAVPNFTLTAGQEKQIPITITIPQNATAGGYYGAVRFAPAGTNNTTGVNLAGSVGSLILVKVPGNIKEQMSIASFDSDKNGSASSFFTTNKGLSTVVRFQNEGNIQEEPFGKILLRDHSNKVLATYEVNNGTPPGNVLPDSIRKFTVNLNDVGSFGEYKLEGNFGYGSSGQLLSASTTFYVIPLSLIIIFILIVLVLAFLIFVLPRMIRAYNRRILSKAGRAMSKASRK
jgi:hypothetical protein